MYIPEYCFVRLHFNFLLWPMIQICPKREADTLVSDFFRDELVNLGRCTTTLQVVQLLLGSLTPSLKKLMRPLDLFYIHSDAIICHCVEMK